MTASSAARTARREAGRLRDSRWFHAVARLGFAVAGLLHVLIGILAISVATGAGAEADQSGALGALGATPFGAVLLWVVVVGLFALFLWQIVEAATVDEPERRKRIAARVKEAGKGVAYLAVGITALRYALGSPKSSEQSTEGAAAGMLASPLGVAAVLLAAVVILAIAGYYLYSGVTKRFLKNINTPAGDVGRAVTVVGQVGYIAKGVALAVVGVLFAAAAFTSDASKAGGLDAALKTLAQLPFGTVALIAVGIGFIAYGGYFGVRAWRARL